MKFAQKDFDLGIALNKGEPKLKEWVDDWVVTNQKERQAQRHLQEVSRPRPARRGDEAVVVSRRRRLDPIRAAPGVEDGNARKGITALRRNHQRSKLRTHGPQRCSVSPALSLARSSRVVLTIRATA